MKKSNLALVIIFVVIILIAFLTSCEKPGEIFNWSCTIQEIRYYKDQKCPDTLYRQVTHFGITSEQHVNWIKSIPDEEQITFDGDTILIRNYVEHCGKSLCL